MSPVAPLAIVAVLGSGGAFLYYKQTEKSEDEAIFAAFQRAMIKAQAEDSSWSGVARTSLVPWIGDAARPVQTRIAVAAGQWRSTVGKLTLPSPAKSLTIALLSADSQGVRANLEAELRAGGLIPKEEIAVAAKAADTSWLGLLKSTAESFEEAVLAFEDRLLDSGDKLAWMPFAIVGGTVVVLALIFKS